MHYAVCIIPMSITISIRYSCKILKYFLFLVLGNPIGFLLPVPLPGISRLFRVFTG